MIDKIVIVLAYSFIYLILLYNQVKGPKFNNTNIILGIKIPQGKIDDIELDRIYSNYKRELIIVGLALTAIFGYIGYFRELLNYIFVAHVIYVFALSSVYLRYNNKAKSLKNREGWAKLAENIRVVDTRYSKERENIRSIFNWAKIPVLIALANFLLAIFMYPRLPLHVRGIFNFSITNSHVYKTPISVFTGIAIQLIIIIIVYFAYYSMFRARVDINPDNVQASIDSNKKYVDKRSKALLGNLILVQIILTYLNMDVLGIVKIDNNFVIIFQVFSAIVVLVNVYLVNKFKLEMTSLSTGKDEFSQYYYEDDNLWKIGNTLYFNPQDPSIFVKKRYGPGYSVNAARPLGMIIVLSAIFIICFALLISINEEIFITIINILT